MIIISGELDRYVYFQICCLHKNCTVIDFFMVFLAILIEVCFTDIKSNADNLMQSVVFLLEYFFKPPPLTFPFYCYVSQLFEYIDHTFFKKIAW